MSRSGGGALARKTKGGRLDKPSGLPRFSKERRDTESREIFEPRRVIGDRGTERGTKRRDFRMGGRGRLEGALQVDVEEREG